MIDERAIIHPRATIAANVQVGPFSIVGADVVIEEGTWIGPHVVIQGPTRIGKNNKIFQFSSIGEDPQDKKYQGEASLLEIGDENIIRECVTISRGTEQGGGVTKLGDHNLLMAYVHIAHDCIVGNHIVFSNNASLAGHVHVGDFANLGGFVGVHQFCAIGAYSFCAGGSIIVKDVLPHVIVAGHPATVHGLNTVGMKRRGLSLEVQSQLKRAYKIIYRSDLTIEEAIDALEKMDPLSVEVALMLDFIRKSARGITR